MRSAIYLSISLAGRRQHQNLTGIARPVHALLDALEGAADNVGNPLHISLLSGLADGGDMLGAEALLGWKPEHGTTVNLTGIFPFEQEDYLRTIDAKARFETLLAACNQKIFLDGHYLPDEENADNTLAKTCREAAYRQQAQYLLEAGDVLLAIADETETGKAGGTLETVEKALSRGIMVIFLSLRNLEFYLITNGTQFSALQAGNTYDIPNGATETANLLMKNLYPG